MLEPHMQELPVGIPLLPPRSSPPLSRRKGVLCLLLIVSPFIILFGLAECEHGLTRLNRCLHEYDLVSSVINSLQYRSNSITVVDCRRLGKYDSNCSRPRPILAKLGRPIDVLGVLANKKELTGGVSIRADLSKQERAAERLLLGERWKLIQSGISQGDLKITFN